MRPGMILNTAVDSQPRASPGVCVVMSTFDGVLHVCRQEAWAVAGGRGKGDAHCTEP